ncbi:beta-1,3-galactosyltransferase 1-like [Littorina saxatilis]|uniref:Hexosyltransferase n=1 Tax=Littorina saxatilis TaxID=31220 RepID=A0AAN9AQW6_9CAEN
MKLHSNVTVFVCLSLASFCLLLLSSHVQFAWPSAGRPDLRAANRAQHVESSRQPRCDGCFNTTFPVFINQPQLCEQSSSMDIINGHHQGTSSRDIIDIVFFIPSSPHASSRRHVIRRTWTSVTGNNTSNLRYVFVVGVTSDYMRMRTLVDESASFRDVVVIGFDDSYLNLTLKTISSLRWLTHHCNHARFFFKVDDDVWVNTDLLLTTFNRQAPSLTSGLGGACPMPHRVIRDTSNKWYASYESYPDDKYPDYCSGTGYGSTLAVANQIVSASRDVPFFHLEDVYVGLCLQRLGLRAVHLDGFHLRPLPTDPCDDTVARRVTFHEVTPSRMTRQWSADCSQQRAEMRRRKKSLFLDFLFLVQ